MAKSRRNKLACDIDPHELIRLYVTCGLTLRACADALGLRTHGGLSYRLKILGVPLREKTIGFKNRKKGDRPPERHGSWKGGKKAISCTQCGKELLRFPSLIRGRNYCGDACHGKWRSENFSGEGNPNYGNDVLAGENNPNWQGGIACEPYGLVWVDKRFKAGIRERDNHTCQNPDCRKNSDGLTIHHIDYDKKNCEPGNLITLCVSCNCRANYNRDFWEAGYKAIIQDKYNQRRSANI